MASFINLLNKNWGEREGKYEEIIASKDKEIRKLKEKIESQNSK